MEHIREITLFTNSTVNSYERLGEFTAPRDILWASDEGSQLIRMNPDGEEYPVELRAADCVCNPYFAFGLMIYASLAGIEAHSQLPAESESIGRLPVTLEEAADCAEGSDFIRKYIPANILENIVSYSRNEWKEYSTAYDKEAFENQKYFYSL